MSEYTPEFREWGKTPRLFRTICVTEKIDGTNAGIHFGSAGEVAAQSRNRLITPDSDNYGFARWVYDHADSLFQLLGPGLHMGEWWGLGIQRRYGMTEKRFSLFNPDKWAGEVRQGGDGEYLEPVVALGSASVTAVPVVYRGVFSGDAIRDVMTDLRDHGSKAAQGWATPEGIVVYHSQSKSRYKVTLDNYDAGKWEVAA